MSIASLLNQTITLYSQSGYDEFGDPSFGDGSSVAARFEAATKRILLPNGQTLTIDAEAFVKSSVTVATEDKVLYDSNYYKVVDIFKVPDAVGNTHHKELRLIKWPSV